MSSSPELAPSASLLVPRLALASCIRACVSRSTVGVPLMAPSQRLNRFPATPLCSITWFIEGEAQVLEPVEYVGRVSRRAMFSGPQTRPSLSYNPGPVRAFVATFFPQAIHDLSGIDIAAWVDRWAPLDEVLGPAWGAMGEAMFAAPDDASCMRILEDFLEPQWREHRSSDAGSIAGDWVRRLSVQAATTGWGKSAHNSARNIERRIKAWAGQPMRTLKRLQRAEQSFLDARDEFMSGKVAWAEVAARGGYSDQAHLCREAREITGVSPSELARAGREDESYWIYRIWS